MKRDNERKMLRSKGGFVTTAEMAMLSGILTVGLTVGATAVRNAMVGELEGVAQSISAISQSYQYAGTASGSTRTAGSIFLDE